MDDFTAVDGETPFEVAEVDLMPGKTVLVQIDLQNDFLHPDGHYSPERYRYRAHAPRHRTHRTIDRGSKAAWSSCRLDATRNERRRGWRSFHEAAAFPARRGIAPEHLGL